MRFSPKLPSIYAKRLKILPRSGPSGSKVVDEKLRNLYSSTINLESKRFPWPSSFLFEKDLVYGGRQLSYLSSKVKNDNSNDALDFPELLEVIPSDVRMDEKKITSFPLLNPWRLRERNVKIDGLTGSESEAQERRSKVLDKLFPASNFPSVTRVLQATMDDQAKSALVKWKERKTEELGEVGFIQQQRKTFYRGSLLHRNIALKLTTPDAELQIPDEISGFWESLEHVFPEISQVKVMEQRVMHPFLCYSGVADCVATMDDELVLIDWKTSSRPKPDLSNLYDEPIQAVSYAGAVNFDQKLKFHIEKVVIVIAYDDGTPADVHQLSHSHCRDYWKLWLCRLQKYWQTLETSKNTASPKK